MVSIVGYWGYIPAKIATKGVQFLDKRMDVREEEIAQIDADIVKDKDKVDRLATSSDKSSKKEWKKEYGKDIKAIKNLSQDIKDLDSIRQEKK